MNDARDKALRSLLTRLAKKHGNAPEDPAAGLCPDHNDPIVHQLVYSMLLWEASHAKAGAAMGKLCAHTVDLNEARVCYADELVAVLGPRYPRVEDRCERLRAALHTVFARENALTLDRLAEMTKRDGLAYLESLEGVPRFVAARVALLTLETHVFPVDQRLADRLIANGLADGGTSPDELASLLERALRAGDARPAYLHIELWADKAKTKTAKARKCPPATKPAASGRPATTRAKTRRKSSKG